MTTSRRPSPVIARRIARCRRAMRKRRISAYLVTNPADYFYLTGFTGEDSAVLLAPRGVHVLTDGRFDLSIRRECPWAKKWLRRGSLNAEIGAVCRKLRLRSLAVQADHVSVKDHATIRKLGGFRRLVSAPPIVGDMRCIKDRTELAVIRKALRIAEAAFLALRRSIRIGQTEVELAACVEYEMRRRGASGPAFATICAEGANAALPHAKPGRRKVGPGSAILVDWGARVDGYCSDLTRMVFVGSIRPALKAVYSVVLEAQRRAIAAIRPGARMRGVDASARDFIAGAGYGDAFMHGLGHGLGLDVHEPPSLSWRSNEKLKAGMVVTVEPGIYLPRVGGVRIEDDILVTPTGGRVLSRLSTKLEDAVVRPRR